MPQRRSLLIAYILWFFFGVFGVHRIYLGRPISALIYFLTGGVFLIGWIVDLFLTYGMVEEENYATF